MVGIGGGVPSDERHDGIRLCNFVVSAPGNSIGSVFHYDFGKRVQDQTFQPTAALNQPPEFLLSAANDAPTEFDEDNPGLEASIKGALEKKPQLKQEYGRPDPASDRLYPSCYVVHPVDSKGVKQFVALAH
ncbi:uncharacterized protein BDW43DRAFT_309409 [Aspergillus alliaceus]|uniref:uncharacterized protein n=1 Tax=Petromyces alliaceus TaxID=209559 RepID=UPI0012A71E85|nr:uncharacterized protein BDW43DRAFT_309409 [Aspergillus alliaceus]KAB8235550.1 hypothetical protein BDW43DRAFT_309409 [Aspergillus alliaceus]